MRREFFTVIFAASLWLAGSAPAAEFKLADGAAITGEPVSPNEKGVIFKTEGGFSTRVEWEKFSPDTLQALLADPKLKPFVEYYLNPAAQSAKADEAKKKKRGAGGTEIVLKDFPKPERPSARPSFAAGLMSPIGLVSLLIFFAAHIYAGYEIAIFRNRPIKLMCLVSLVPVAGPVFCLCLPTVPRQTVADGPPKPAHEHVLPSVAAAEAEAAARAQALAAAPPTVEEKPPAPPPDTVYARGEFTFNRRFFETKLAGFMRLVPGDAEKKLEMAFTTSRGDFVSRRISKLEAESLLLAIQKGDTFYEEKVPYIEIREVRLRPRGDATA